MKLIQFLDISNAFFEAGGAYWSWKNVQALWRDRRTAGVDWRATMFFGAWGLFNLLFYPLMGLWLSAFAGGVLASANFTWIWYAKKYERINHMGTICLND